MEPGAQDGAKKVIATQANHSIRVLWVTAVTRPRARRGTALYTRRGPSPPQRPRRERDHFGGLSPSAPPRVELPQGAEPYWNASLDTPEPAVASQIIHHLLSLRARAACVDRRSGHRAVRGTGWDLTTYRGTAGASVVYPLGMARGRSYPPRGRLVGPD